MPINKLDNWSTGETTIICKFESTTTDIKLCSNQS